MSNTIELTKEQEAKIPAYIDKFYDQFYRNPKYAELEEVEQFVHWFYKHFMEEAVDKKPKVVLLDSPEALRIAVGLVEDFDIDLRVLSNDQISELVHKVKNVKIRSEESNKSVKQEVLPPVSKTSEEVYQKALEKINSRPLEIYYYAPTYYLSSFNTWIPFYEFFDVEVEPLEESEMFNQYKEVMNLGIFWSLTFEGFCFVSRNPLYYKINERRDLHSTEGPVIEFRDGYKGYYINGLHIKAEIYDKWLNNTYTIEDFVQEKNEEIKAASISFIQEKHGDEAIYRLLESSMSQVDTYTDIKDPKYTENVRKAMEIGTYTLFKGSLEFRRGEVKIAYVRCFDPSSDRMFFLQVSPENTNAKDAIASLCRMPKKLVPYLEEIRRQGENFITYFTDEGIEYVKNLTPEEAKDLVSIDGDTYFSKMTYEY